MEESGWASGQDKPPLLLDPRAAASSEPCSCHSSDVGLYHMFRSQLTEACIRQCVLPSNCGTSDESDR